MSGASGADRRVVAPDKSSSGTVAETPPPLVLDSALTPEVPFTPLAVTMYGYAKRVSDARETFVLRLPMTLNSWRFFIKKQCQI